MTQSLSLRRSSTLQHSSHSVIYKLCPHLNVELSCDDQRTYESGSLHRTVGGYNVHSFMIRPVRLKDSPLELEQSNQTPRPKTLEDVFPPSTSSAQAFADTWQLKQMTALAIQRDFSETSFRC